MDNGNDPPAHIPNLEFSDENSKSLKFNSGFMTFMCSDCGLIL